jgi:hypothetical protein
MEKGSLGVGAEVGVSHAASPAKAKAKSAERFMDVPSEIIRRLVEKRHWIRRGALLV